VVDGTDEAGERGRESDLGALARTALASYPLGVRRIELLADYTNTLFRVESGAGAAFVIRVGIAGPVAHPEAVIRSEMMWLEALDRETDLVVPRPLRTRDGELLVSASTPRAGPRNCVVTSFLPGRLLAHRLDGAGMRSLGVFAARLHEHGAAMKPPPGFSIPAYDSALPYGRPAALFAGEHRDLAPPGLPDRCEEMRDLVEQAIGRLAGRQPARVIHGDLYPWNALVSEGAIGVVDFEELLWGWPVQDIAGTFFTLWERPDFPALGDAFRDGYASIAGWPVEEPDEIPTFMAGRALILANDVLLQPEWRREAPSVLADLEHRIDAVLG
jgi:Ser/Thr protein kinase RdoA (MazF antagonist)